MIYMGIDPGQKGAIAVIEKSQQNAKVFDMSDNAYTLHEILVPYIKKQDVIFCVLEKAQPMPKQGVKGIFTYGVGYGKIKAVLEILTISFQEVHPAIWKKEFSLIKKGKEESIKVARQLFPDQNCFYTERGRMLDGRAEALLLALYGQRLYNKMKI